MASLDGEGSRLDPVRRRATLAKAGFALGAAVVFGTAFAVARAQHPGHEKERLRPLSASRRYFAEVQKSFGDTGIIAPALSSPTAATNLS